MRVKIYWMYRDDSVLHDGLSASYDHADDLLRDLGGHIHALRAQALSLLQFHESLESRRGHGGGHFSRGRFRTLSVHRDYSQLSRALLFMARHLHNNSQRERNSRTNERIRVSANRDTLSWTIIEYAKLYARASPDSVTLPRPLVARWPDFVSRIATI